MSAPAIAITEEQLREVHRSLPHAVSFEVMQQCPALVICLRTMAEIRARRIATAAAAPEPERAPRAPRARPRAPQIDRKRAAANDLD